MFIIYIFVFTNIFFLSHREWTEDGQLWIQYVSATPATRSDVLNLQEQLNHNLQARQARETGICPVRQELYSQCFGKIYYFFYIIYIIFFINFFLHFLLLIR